MVIGACFPTSRKLVCASPGLTASVTSAADSKIRRQHDANMCVSPIGGFARLAEPERAGYRLSLGLDTQSGAPCVLSCRTRYKPPP